MKFYVVDFEDGSSVWGYFKSYTEALDYAEAFNLTSVDFTISEYDSENDYFNNL